MEDLTDFVVIDPSTSEIIQFLTKKELAYLKYNRTSAQVPSNKFIPKKDTFNSMLKEYCGNFCFFFYNKKTEINNTYLFRFIYLSTFANYKGYIQFGKTKNTNSEIKKKHLQEILGLQRTETYNTIKYFEQNNMIHYDEEGFVMINVGMSKRGKLNKKEDKLDYSRMFDNQIRELYNNSSPKEHRTLGAMLRLLPYVHFKTNIICSNPTEEDYRKIKPLKLNEILQLINVSKTTIKTLMDFKIMNGSESVFIKTSNAFIRNFYIINPRITYKGLASSVDDERNFIFETSLNYFKVGSYN